MSGFTLSGGLAFSGGFTFTEAPSENTAAWFGGGGPFAPFRETVQRITFATDTNTASVRGPLSSVMTGGAAAGGIQ